MKEYLPLIIAGVFAIIPVIGIILCILDKIFDTSYSCKVLGWHNGNLQTKETHMLPGQTSMDAASTPGAVSVRKK